MADGFAELEQDHRAIEEQFQTLLRDNEAPVVRELAERLTRHSQLEEAALYPALRRWVDGGDDIADRAQQEHAQIATMVAALYDSATPERLEELVASLQDAVSAHVEFEESEIFPVMREAGIDADRIALDLRESESSRARRAS
jgi:hemerythrin superfamily protein